MAWYGDFFKIKSGKGRGKVGGDVLKERSMPQKQNCLNDSSKLLCRRIKSAKTSQTPGTLTTTEVTSLDKVLALLHIMLASLT